MIDISGHNMVEKLLDNRGVFTPNGIEILFDRKPFDFCCLLVLD
jgi:hypothetical protein